MPAPLLLLLTVLLGAPLSARADDLIVLLSTIVPELHAGRCRSGACRPARCKPQRS